MKAKWDFAKIDLNPWCKSLKVIRKWGMPLHYKHLSETKDYNPIITPQCQQTGY